jgi:hypothetical protein
MDAYSLLFYRRFDMTYFSTKKTEMVRACNTDRGEERYIQGLGGET